MSPPKIIFLIYWHVCRCIICVLLPLDSKIREIHEHKKFSSTKHIGRFPRKSHSVVNEEMKEWRNEPPLCRGVKRGSEGWGNLPSSHQAGSVEEPGSNLGRSDLQFKFITILPHCLWDPGTGDASSQQRHSNPAGVPSRRHELSANVWMSVSISSRLEKRQR